MDVRVSLLFLGLIALVLATGTVQAKEWETPLQKHVAFFDRDGDGIVYPRETYRGFRAIGAGIPLATASSILINTALSSKTRPGKPKSLQFPIEIENIKLAKHGSDSGAYDTEGRFVESNVEDIFSKHAHTKPNALTSDELDEMLKARRQPGDKAGALGALSEWKILHHLAKDKDGFLQKETVKKVYDGTLFYEMEKQHQEKLASKKKNNRKLY